MSGLERDLDESEGEGAPHRLAIKYKGSNPLPADVAREAGGEPGSAGRHEQWAMRPAFGCRAPPREMTTKARTDELCELSPIPFRL